MALKYLFAFFLFATYLKKIVLAEEGDACYAEWVGGNPIDECSFLLTGKITLSLDKLVEGVTKFKICISVTWHPNTYCFHRIGAKKKLIFNV